MVCKIATNNSEDLSLHGWVVPYLPICKYEYGRCTNTMTKGASVHGRVRI